MSEHKKKFLEEQLLTNEVSKFELSFYEKMSGKAFLDDDLFKILRVFSEVNTLNVIPCFLNQDYLFWIDDHDMVSINQIANSEWCFIKEQYIFLCKMNDQILNFNEKKEVERFVQKIDDLNIEQGDFEKEKVINFPINLLYLQSVKVGFS